MQSIRIRATGRRAGTALLLGGVLLLATACGGGNGGTGGGGATHAQGNAQGKAPVVAAGNTSAAPKTSAAVVDVEPKNGSQDVAPNGALKVSVTSGKLTQVAVTGADGKPVAARWRPTG